MTSRLAAPAKVGFVSLGCPKNLVDSEVMMGMLAQAGAELTPNAEDADVIVVNTCSFIGTAQQESIDTILEMARHKTGGKAKRLVVAGCLVERFHDEIRKNIPEVDAVVGTGELERILAAAGVEEAPRAPGPFNILGSNTLTSRPEGDHRREQGRFARDSWDGAVADLPNYLYDDHTPRVLTTPRSSAYIKIAEGCDHPCSFCIIPQLRGQFRSRRFESVIAEAERLARSDVREITLIGQDTTCYGEDLGLKDGLAVLLEKLAGVEGLQWIRFLYAYPNKITGRLLETIAAHDNICSYIDVPLQHASATVLKRMKRGGGADLFLRSIEKMRRVIPGVTLRTSFIVGFPGETEEDFEGTLSLLDAVQYDGAFSFKYSPRPNTPALSMPCAVPEEEKGRRLAILQDRQRQIQTARHESLVDQSFEVLADARHEAKSQWAGRTSSNRVVNFTSPLENLLGEYVQVRITRAGPNSLVGEQAI